MKQLKKVMAALCAAGCIAILCVLPAQAADGAISVAGSTTVGSTVKATVSVQAGEVISSAESTITFDSTVLQVASVSGVSSGDYTISDGTLHIIDSNFNGTDTTASYTVTFKAIAEGSSSISLSGTYANADFNEGSFSSSAGIAVAAKPEAETTTSSETETDVTPKVDLLAVTIGEEGYHVVAAPDADAVPAGMDLTTVTYNGTDVQIFTDAENTYAIYYLKNDTTGVKDYYVVDAAQGNFVLLSYVKCGGKIYIFADWDTDFAVPMGYARTTASVGNATVPAVCSNEDGLQDFCYLYCFANGTNGWYSYDMVEETIQRAPTFGKQSATAAVVADAVEKEEVGLLAGLHSLEARAKVALVVFAVAGICVVALVVLLILHWADRRAAAAPAAEDFSFDELDLEDEFSGDCADAYAKEAEAAKSAEDLQPAADGKE